MLGVIFAGLEKFPLGLESRGLFPMVRVAYEQDTNWDCLDVRQFWCRPLPLDEWKAHPNSPCSHEFVLRVSPSWALSHKMAPNHAPLLEEDFAMFFWPVHGWVVSLHIHIYIYVYFYIYTYIYQATTPKPRDSEFLVLSSACQEKCCPTYSLTVPVEAIWMVSCPINGPTPCNVER